MGKCMNSHWAWAFRRGCGGVKEDFPLSEEGGIEPRSVLPNKEPHGEVWREPELGNTAGPDASWPVGLSVILRAKLSPL